MIVDSHTAAEIVHIYYLPILFKVYYNSVDRILTLIQWKCRVCLLTLSSWSLVCGTLVSLWTSQETRVYLGSANCGLESLGEQSVAADELLQRMQKRERINTGIINTQGPTFGNSCPQRRHWSLQNLPRCVRLWINC